jgi:Holliday junction DNA helicase RuvA
VVIELKDKAPTVMAMGAAGPTDTDDDVIEDIVETPKKPAPKRKAPRANATAQPDALSALGNLGYAPGEAAAAVAQAAADTPEADTPALIRAALKLLAPAN